MSADQVRAAQRTLVDLAAQRLTATDAVAAVWADVCAAAAARRERLG
ncbi:MAG: hypothetical protein Q8M22_19720 [Actinomycetota bacterium]|nr:hypothetical protein [Actinomycetota bacterium]